MPPLPSCLALLPFSLSAFASQARWGESGNGQGRRVTRRRRRSGRQMAKRESGSTLESRLPKKFLPRSPAQLKSNPPAFSFALFDFCAGIRAQTETSGRGLPYLGSAIKAVQSPPRPPFPVLFLPPPPSPPLPSSVQHHSPECQVRKKLIRVKRDLLPPPPPLSLSLLGQNPIAVHLVLAMLL